MRDDSTGLWLPMGGGGLSNVSVRKRIIQTAHDDVKSEYFIYGKRISDQRVSFCLKFIFSVYTFKTFKIKNPKFENKMHKN